MRSSAMFNIESANRNFLSSVPPERHIESWLGVTFDIFQSLLAESISNQTFEQFIKIFMHILIAMS